MESRRRLGRYCLLQRIARGGMGEVHLGELEAPGNVRRLVAIKLLLEANPEAQAALLSEARLAALISHPNVVQLLDAGLDDGIAWFAMEFVPGPSLAELFDAASGNVPPWIAARLVADACSALHAVHEATDRAGAALQIVHRDVTPHNILVSTSGFVKLADFGIARSALHNLLTKTGVVKGKLGYLSPEQAAGGSVDRRSDIFSMGILLWELLTGTRLFRQATEGETMAAILRAEAPSVRERAPHVPPALDRIAERALQKDPGARYTSALEMQRALESALQGSGAHVGAPEVAQVVANVPPGAAQKALDWVRKGPVDEEPPPIESSTAVSEALAPPGQPLRSGRSIPRRAAAVGVVALIGAALIATAMAFSPKTPEPLPPRTATADLQSPEPQRTERAIVSSQEERPSGRPSDPAAQAMGSGRPSDPAAQAMGSGRKPKSAPPASSQRTTPTPAASAAPAPSASAVVATGTINVSARPKWALVSVDGKSVGSTPVAVSSLSAGAHVIDAVLLGDGPAQRKTVEVEAGKIVKVHFVFP